jgi:hypothetical protein
MPSIAEPQLSGIAAALAQAEKTISLSNQIVFTQYQRAVLPLDGLVFWIATTTTKTVDCSIHVETLTEQNESESMGVGHIVMTALEPLDDLMAESPTTKWIAVWKGMHIGFTRTKHFYGPSALYHFLGRALLSTELTQVIDTPGSLDPTLLIASNSIPAFILMNSWVAPYYNPYNNNANAIPPATPTPLLTLPTIYPAFLAPANIAPPYATVQVDRSDNLAPVAWQDIDSNPYGLASDDVRITMFGLTNNQAWLFKDALVQFCADAGVIGLQEIGAIVDERATQSDFLIVGQKKTLKMKVSYTQAAVIDFARQQFTAVTTAYTPQDLVLPPPSPLLKGD